MKVHPIFTFIIIALLLFSLASPAIAGKNVAKDPQTEIKSSAKDIDVLPKELTKGDIKVADVDTSKFKAEMKDGGISIKAQLDKKDHKREVTISRKALEKVKGFDGKKVYAHHFNDDGVYTGYQVVHIGKASEVIFVAEFSEIILSGFSGYYQVTQTLSSGENITVPAGVDRVEVSVAGDVPVYQAINWNDVTTLPKHVSLIAGYYPATYGYYDITGNGYNLSSYYSENGVLCNDSGFVFNGTDFLYTSKTHKSWLNGAQYVKFDIQTLPTISFIPLISKGLVGGVGWEAGTQISYWYKTDYKAVAQTEPLASNGNLIGQVGVTTEILSTWKNNGNNTTSHYVYYDDNSVEYFYTYNVNHGENRGFKVGGATTRILNGSISEVLLYNTTLTNEDYNILYNGFSGIQISDTPYTGSTLTLPENTTEVEYIATDDVDREVTVRAYFTEDITLIEETETDGEVFISINHTAGQNVSAGYLEYTPTTDNSTYSPVLNSTNENATVAYVNGALNISTGPLVAGENHFYNVTMRAPPQESFANPVFVVTSFALIVFATARFMFGRRKR